MNPLSTRVQLDLQSHRETHWYNSQEDHECVSQANRLVVLVRVEGGREVRGGRGGWRRERRGGRLGEGRGGEGRGGEGRIGQKQGAHQVLLIRQGPNLHKVLPIGNSTNPLPVVQSNKLQLQTHNSVNIHVNAKVNQRSREHGR